MKRELNFWVLGGDLRQACLARLLAEDGHRVHTYALSGSVVTPTENLTLADSLDGIGRADCVVLPLPVAGAEGMVNTPLPALPFPWPLCWMPSHPPDPVRRPGRPGLRRYG